MLRCYAHYLLQMNCYGVYCSCVGFVECSVVNNGSSNVLCISWTCQIKFNCTVRHTSNNEL